MPGLIAILLDVVCVAFAVATLETRLDAAETDALVAVGKAADVNMSGLCAAEGVSCRAGHVEELHVAGITGSAEKSGFHLHASVCNLTQLKVLKLPARNLQGTIPDCLGMSLNQLEILDLSGNALHGSIQRNMCLLKKLRLLKLHKNMLSGILASCLAGLTSLRTLNVGHNQIAGTLPEGNWKSLVELRVGFNPITGSIPASYGNLTKLKSLVLSDTLVSGFIPPSLGSLGSKSSLRLLNLANTKVSGEIPDAVAGLPALVDFRIERTFLERMPAFLDCTKPLSAMRPFCFCPPGTQAAPGSRSCTYCGLHTYYPYIAAGQCMQCPIGTVTTHVGATSSFSCLCERGSELDTRGRCVQCRAGYEGKTPQNCTKCAPGRHMPLSGGTQCLACLPGAHQGSAGQSFCDTCTKSTFQSHEGQSACISCEATFVTAAPASSSASACICAGGTSFSADTRRCHTCPSHVHCPGGHQQGNASQDRTPMIEEGYMSLERLPLSVFSCIDGKARCVGRRSPFSSASIGGMCPDNFARMPQCAVCSPGFFHDLRGSCVPCGETRMHIFISKILCSLALQCLVVLYMYSKSKSDHSSGMGMIGTALSFVQYLQTLGQLPLRWPPALAQMFSWVSFLMEPRMLFLRQIKPECHLGNGFFRMLLVETMSPLLLFMHLALLGIAFRLFGRRIDMNHLVSVVGTVFNGLFITITRLTLALFLVDPMPNGRDMVKAFPELEYNSDDWRRVWPIGALAFCAYNLSFFVFVARATVMAPKLAATWPDFNQRYGFAFSHLHPDRWWWALPMLALGCGLTAVQVISRNVQTQLYMSIFLLISFTAVQFHIQPFKFDDNNITDLASKLALIVLLVFATSFVDERVMPDQQLKANWKTYATIMLAVTALSFIFIGFKFLRWVHRMFYPLCTSVGLAAKLTFEFRDVMARLMLVSDKEILARVHNLQDADLTSLAAARNIVIATLFEEQPGTSLFEQRVLPGVRFRVFDHHSNTAELLAAAQAGEVQAAVQSNAARRLQLLVLARELEKSCPESWDLETPFHECQPHEDGAGPKRGMTRALSQSFDSIKSTVASKRWSFTSGLSSSAVDIMRRSQGKTNALKENLRRSSSLKDQDLEGIFDMFDFDDNGSISLRKIAIAMKGMASRGLVDFLPDVMKKAGHKLPVDEGAQGEDVSLSRSFAPTPRTACDEVDDRRSGSEPCIASSDLCLGGSEVSSVGVRDVPPSLQKKSWCMSVASAGPSSIRSCSSCHCSSPETSAIALMEV